LLFKKKKIKLERSDLYTIVCNLYYQGRNVINTYLVSKHWTILYYYMSVCFSKTK